MRSRFDDALATIARRPRPAATALLIGLLVGFTLAIAVSDFSSRSLGNPSTSPLAGQTADPPPAQTLADEDSGEDADRPKRSIKKPRSAQRRPSGDLSAAVQAAVDEARGVNVGIAAVKLSGGRLHAAGSTGAFQVWSTIKVPAVTLYLSMHPNPSAEASVHIEQAIRASSNLDMRAIYNQIVDEQGVAGANAALRDLVARAGGELLSLDDRRDPSIDDGVAIGTARWTAASAARFLQAFAGGCLLPSVPEAVRTVLTHMNHLTQGAWGAPAAFPSDRVFAKGGWTTDGSTVSQFAVIGRSRDAYVVAVMTEPGSYRAGQRLIERMLKAFRAVAGTPRGGGDPLPRKCGAGAAADESSPPADESHTSAGASGATGLELPEYREPTTIAPDADADAAGAD